MEFYCFPNFYWFSTDKPPLSKLWILEKNLDLVNHRIFTSSGLRLTVFAATVERKLVTLLCRVCASLYTNLGIEHLIVRTELKNCLQFRWILHFWFFSHQTKKKVKKSNFKLNLANGRAVFNFWQKSFQSFFNNAVSKVHKYSITPRTIVDGNWALCANNQKTCKAYPVSCINFSDFLLWITLLKHLLVFIVWSCLFQTDLEKTELDLLQCLHTLYVRPTSIIIN